MIRHGYGAFERYDRVYTATLRRDPDAAIRRGANTPLGTTRYRTVQHGPNRETRHNAVRSDPNGTGLRSAVRKEKGRAGESRSHTRAREGAGNFSSRDGSAICARCPQLPGEEDAEDGNLRVVRTDGSGIPGTRRAAPEPAGTCRDQRYGRAIRRKARAASGTDNRNVRNNEI